MRRVGKGNIRVGDKRVGPIEVSLCKPLATYYLLHVESIEVSLCKLIRTPFGQVPHLAGGVWGHATCLECEAGYNTDVRVG